MGFRGERSPLSLSPVEALKTGEDAKLPKEKVAKAAGEAKLVDRVMEAGWGFRKNFLGSGGGGCQTFLGDVCFSLFEKAWVDQQYDPQTSTIFLKWWLCHPRG